MLNVEEFKSKLEKIRRKINNSNLSKAEEEPYVIPEEFKGYYFGKFGECDYDTRMFEVGRDYDSTFLHYKKDCGLAPIMPEGVH